MIEVTRKAVTDLPENRNVRTCCRSAAGGLPKGVTRGSIEDLIVFSR